MGHSTVNSPALPHLKRGEDGSLTIYNGKDSPGADKQSNWRPAPDAVANPVTRTYWPKPEILDGAWTAPAIVPVS